jgi:rhodanese-related sulfurtransferase
MPRQEPGEAYYRIGVDEAAEMFGQDEVAFIDVRTPREYAEGHIKDAIFIPHEEIFARVEELPSGKKLLFICAAGVRSGLACEIAAAMGIDTEKLFNIEDGTPTWVERGHPTSYGEDP